MLIPVFLFFHKWKNWGQQKWSIFPKVLRTELNQPGPNSETQTYMVPPVRRSGHQEVLRCELNQPGPNTQTQTLWHHQ